MLSKEEIRTKIITKCNTIDRTLRAEAAVNVLRFIKNNLLKDVNKVSIYHACNFELDLAKLINNLFALDIKVYEPIAYKHTKNMRFSRLIPEKYTKEKQSTKPQLFFSPDTPIIDELEWYNLDLVLVPLVAISHEGYRLGRGAGYYDVTFADMRDLPTGKRPILCGMGFDIQLVKAISTDSWDIKLDFFVSEKRIIKF